MTTQVNRGFNRREQHVARPGVRSTARPRAPRPDESASRGAPIPLARADDNEHASAAAMFPAALPFTNLIGWGARCPA